MDSPASLLTFGGFHSPLEHFESDTRADTFPSVEGSVIYQTIEPRAPAVAELIVSQTTPSGGDG